MLVSQAVVGLTCTQVSTRRRVCQMKKSEDYPFSCACCSFYAFIIVRPLREPALPCPGRTRTHYTIRLCTIGFWFIDFKGRTNCHHFITVHLTRYAHAFIVGKGINYGHSAVVVVVAVLVYRSADSYDLQEIFFSLLCYIAIYC